MVKRKESREQHEDLREQEDDSSGFSHGVGRGGLTFILNDRAGLFCRLFHRAGIMRGAGGLSSAARSSKAAASPRVNAALFHRVK